MPRTHLGPWPVRLWAALLLLLAIAAGAGAQRLLGASPAVGLVSGGAAVTLRGDALFAARRRAVDRVLFGGRAAAILEWPADAAALAVSAPVSPSAGPGLVPVEIRFAGDAYPPQLLTDGYQYAAAGCAALERPDSNPAFLAAAPSADAAAPRECGWLFEYPGAARLFLHVPPDGVPPSGTARWRAFNGSSAAAPPLPLRASPDGLSAALEGGGPLFLQFQQIGPAPAAGPPPLFFRARLLAAYKPFLVSLDPIGPPGARTGSALRPLLDPDHVSSALAVALRLPAPGAAFEFAFLPPPPSVDPAAPHVLAPLHVPDAGPASLVLAPAGSGENKNASLAFRGGAALRVLGNGTRLALRRLVFRALPAPLALEGLAEASLEGAAFANCSAGALRLRSVAQAALADVSFEGVSGVQGALVASAVERLSLRRVRFDGCAARAGRGGALAVSDAASTVLQSVSFGGSLSPAASFARTASADLADCGFEGGRGPALLLERTGATLARCRFSDNVAGDGDGGAIRAASASLFASDCRFERNRAGSGGAIHIANSTATLSACLFEANTAAAAGGALAALRSHLRVSDSEFRGASGAGAHAASVAAGGALALEESGADLETVAFRELSAEAGGALHVRGAGNATVTCTGCTFDAVQATLGGGVYVGRQQDTSSAIQDPAAVAALSAPVRPSGSSPGPTLVLENADARDAAGGRGGFLHAAGASALRLVNCSLAAVRAAEAGAALYARGVQSLSVAGLRLESAAGPGWAIDAQTDAGEFEADSAVNLEGVSVMDLAANARGLASLGAASAALADITFAAATADFEAAPACLAVYAGRDLSLARALFSGCSSLDLAAGGSAGVEDVEWRGARSAAVSTVSAGADLRAERISLADVAAGGLALSAGRGAALLDFDAHRLACPVSLESASALVLARFAIENTLAPDAGPALRLAAASGQVAVGPGSLAGAARRLLDAHFANASVALRDIALVRGASAAAGIALTIAGGSLSATNVSAVRGAFSDAAIDVAASGEASVAVAGVHCVGVSGPCVRVDASLPSLPSSSPSFSSVDVVLVEGVEAEGGSGPAVALRGPASVRSLRCAGVAGPCVLVDPPSLPPQSSPFFSSSVVLVEGVESEGGAGPAVALRGPAAVRGLRCLRTASCLVAGPGASADVDVEGLVALGGAPAGEAAAGPAVLAEGGARLALRDCLFVGGACVAVEHSAADLADCRFEGAAAAARGGAVAVRGGDVTLRRCAFADCGAAGGDGGAIFAAEGARVQVLDCGFDRCAADRGGAAVVAGGAKLELVDSRLSDCTAADAGGGAHAEGAGAVLRLNRTRVAGCSAGVAGGGVAVAFAASAALVDSDVSGNRAGRGGGVFAGEGASLEVLRGALSDNAAAKAGGAVSAKGARASLAGVTLRSNQAAFGGAAALEGAGGELALAADARLAANAAARYGAALYAGPGVGCAQLRLPEDPAALFDANQAGVAGGTLFWGGRWPLDPACTLWRVCASGAAAAAGGADGAGSYGPRCASGAVRADVGGLPPILGSGEPVSINATFTDLFGSVVAEDGQSTLAARVAPLQPPAPAASGLVLPVVSEGAAVARAGVASLPRLSVLWHPGSSAAIVVEARMANLSWPEDRDSASLPPPAAFSRTFDVAFAPCRAGEVQLPNEFSCYTCPPGTFSLWAFPESRGKICSACPDGGACGGGAGAASEASLGFWSSPYDPSFFLPCLTDACATVETSASASGSGSGSASRRRLAQDLVLAPPPPPPSSSSSVGFRACKPGYTGPMCTACDAGYGRVDALNCVPCTGFRGTGGGVAFFFVVYLGLLYMMAATVAVSLRRPPRSASASAPRPKSPLPAATATGTATATATATPAAALADALPLVPLLRVFVDHIQTMHILGRMDVRWPAGAAVSFRVHGALYDPFSSAVSVDCVLGGGDEPVFRRVGFYLGMFLATVLLALLSPFYIWRLRAPDPAAKKLRSRSRRPRPAEGDRTAGESGTGGEQEQERGPEGTAPAEPEQPPAAARDREVVFSVWPTVLGSLLLLLWWVVPMTYAKIFQLYGCWHLGGGRYFLRSDLTADCATDKYRSLRDALGPVAMVVCVGLWLAWLAALVWRATARHYGWSPLPFRYDGAGALAAKSAAGAGAGEASFSVGVGAAAAADDRELRRALRAADRLERFRWRATYGLLFEGVPAGWPVFELVSALRKLAAAVCIAAIHGWAAQERQAQAPAVLAVLLASLPAAFGLHGWPGRLHALAWWIHTATALAAVFIPLVSSAVQSNVGVALAVFQLLFLVASFALLLVSAFRETRPDRERRRSLWSWAAAPATPAGGAPQQRSSRSRPFAAVPFRGAGAAQQSPPAPMHPYPQAPAPFPPAGYEPGSAAYYDVGPSAHDHPLSPDRYALPQPSYWAPNPPPPQYGYGVGGAEAAAAVGLGPDLRSALEEVRDGPRASGSPPGFETSFASAGGDEYADAHAPYVHVPPTSSSFRPRAALSPRPALGPSPWPALSPRPAAVLSPRPLLSPRPFDALSPRGIEAPQPLSMHMGAMGRGGGAGPMPLGDLLAAVDELRASPARAGRGASPRGFEFERGAGAGAASSSFGASLEQLRDAYRL
eukprot:tig00020603_g11810.t1